jgi:uncharacterized protein (TIGR03435 family)
MATLADLLFRVLTTSFENPVMDMTGLEGGWDFDLKASYRGAQGSSDISIFNAVERQLGLKLERRKIEKPVVVVERINRKPRENPPGAAENLPPRPREFEVAVLRPTDPGATNPGFRVLPGGKVELRGIPLQTLIIVAWDITPDMVVGAPNWLARERFDIVAQAPAGVAPADRPMDFDVLRLMLRALLMQRFKMATHTETRPVEVFVLTAGNRAPKLEKADGAARAGCRWAPPPPDRNSPLTSGMACRNLTMAQLPATLRAWATAYITRPVVDQTGIEGGWDFLLRWSPARNIPGQLPGGAAGPSSGAPGPAADPTGGMTIFEALDRQLGLKLEIKKHPMPVLVIDHVEEKPTEN